MKHNFYISARPVHSSKSHQACIDFIFTLDMHIYTVRQKLMSLFTMQSPSWLFPCESVIEIIYYIHIAVWLLFRPSRSMPGRAGPYNAGPSTRAGRARWIKIGKIKLALFFVVNLYPGPAPQACRYCDIKMAGTRSNPFFLDAGSLEHGLISMDGCWPECVRSRWSVSATTNLWHVVQWSAACQLGWLMRMWGGFRWGWRWGWRGGAG